MTAPVTELHTLKAVARAGNTLASQFKEYGVAEIHPHFDIPPHLVAFRGEGGRHGVLLEVMCSKVDRDEGLDTLMGLAAMDCVAVALTYDAHTATTDINPRTGEKWGPGEMQGLCDGEGACDTGLLTDCLMTVGIFVDGEIAGWNHSYHFHEAKREIAWVDEDDDPSNDELVRIGGFVPDTMKELMKEGRTRSSLLMSGMFVDMPDHARARRDAGILRAFNERGAIVRVSRHIASDSKERAIFRRVVRECEHVYWMDGGV